jgi:glycerol uptake facilitator-like aquaporin
MLWRCRSGGHVNPAITLTWAIIGKLQWFKVPVYWLAQYLGAFMGASTVFMVYRGTNLKNANRGV